MAVDTHTTETAWIFAPAPQPSLAIDGDTARFPVRRIWCVGRNYAAHAREMGADPAREAPFFFAKPADAVVPAPSDDARCGDISYPPATRKLHHEVELVVALHRGGRNLDALAALDCVFGYGVGLDLTRRDLQADARQAGKPWDMAKGFDQSAPCSALQPAARIGHPTAGAITLTVRGVLRQKGDLSDLIWNVGETLAHLSRLVALQPGDVVFTGTPEGVGPLLPGDEVEATVEGVATLQVRITV